MHSKQLGANINILVRTHSFVCACSIKTVLLNAYTTTTIDSNGLVYYILGRSVYQSLGRSIHKQHRSTVGLSATICLSLNFSMNENLWHKSIDEFGNKQHTQSAPLLLLLSTTATVKKWKRKIPLYPSFWNFRSPSLSIASKNIYQASDTEEGGKSRTTRGRNTPN